MLGVLNILRVLNMSGLHKVLNKIFLDRCLQYSEYSEYVLDSEYATVLNILELHKVGNKIFRHRYLAGF